MKRKVFLENIAAKIGEIGWVRSLLLPLWYKLYINPMVESRRKAYLSHGIKVLEKLDVVFKENRISYTLIFGTLLGAIRERGFIKHDLDIDIAVWFDTDNKMIERCLTESGFRLYRRIEVCGGEFGREETYFYNNVSIDLFYFYPYDEKFKYTNVFVTFDNCKTWDDSMKKHGGLLPLKLILPLSREVKYVPFETLYLPVADNAIEFIEARYGKSWRTPDPTFVYPKMGDALFEYCRDKVGVVHL